MFIRLPKLEKDQNILLLGPRGTGKSTLLRGLYPKDTSYWIDLLLPATEDLLCPRPRAIIT